ncbi:hypothetical protein [Sulfurihydrogenibium subterraneum]|uniref:hypothetical protein n=1 Tax=Sulfurihydrogenibium subterraneum TaxID=171121 RepID=UPI00048EE2EE|nr:hypothetical protein [Sulfurihydrogenibium subterraneum]
MKLKFILSITAFYFLIGKAENLNLPPIQDVTPFVGLENAVGYIQKENGEKFIVVETPEGTKLVKVKTNPKKLIEKSEIK